MIWKMLFIWKDCFARNLKEIRTTDFIQHTINLKPNVRLIYSKILRYNRKKRQFAAEIFLKMKKRELSPEPPAIRELAASFC